MIWHFCTLQTDHQDKSSYVISPCKDTTWLSTLFPTLWISYGWLIYLATGNLYLLISLIYFFHPPGLFLSDNNLLVLCPNGPFCFVRSVHFFFADSTCKWNHVSVKLISLSIILSRSMLLQMARYHYFLWLRNSPRMCVWHLYPFIYWWALVSIS